MWGSVFVVNRGRSSFVFITESELFCVFSFLNRGVVGGVGFREGGDIEYEVRGGVS